MPFVMVTSPSLPLLLCSLCKALLPLGLRSLEPVVSLFTSPEKFESRVGAFQEGIPHIMPVNDLSWMPLRSQRRHGLPVRSSARRPALIAPVLAFGPSLCAGIGAAVVGRPVARSIVPSAL